MVMPNHRYATPPKSALRQTIQLPYYHQPAGYWPGYVAQPAPYLVDPIAAGTNTGIMGDPRTLPAVTPPQTPHIAPIRAPQVASTPLVSPPPTPAWAAATYTPFTSTGAVLPPNQPLWLAQTPVGPYTPFAAAPVTPMTPSALIAPCGYIAAPPCPNPWTPSAYLQGLPAVVPADALALEESLVGSRLDKSSPRIKWDIACMPTVAAKKITCRGLYDNISWDTNASEPGLNRIFITCSGDIGKWMDWWGPITISKDSGSAITVKDVLDAIYEYFHKQLRQDDVDRAEALSPNNYNALKNAFWKRVNFVNLGTIKEVEISHGLRRVDCLGDWRGFRSITPERIDVGDSGIRWKFVLNFDPVEI